MLYSYRIYSCGLVCALGFDTPLGCEDVLAVNRAYDVRSIYRYERVANIATHMPVDDDVECP